jgi:phosphatidylinositol kinase/protein kinase (PI-3  family)
MRLVLTKELRTCRRILSSGIRIAVPNSALVFDPEACSHYSFIKGRICGSTGRDSKDVDFDEYCMALPSLQRPKKLRLNLNDGSSLTVLLKPKDDLRKDCRFMELCQSLNAVFRNQGSAFSVKIYAVSPLNDECGVIEWVDNTVSFRSILLKLYKRLGISVATRDLKDVMAMKISPYDKYMNFFLPKYFSLVLRHDNFL